MSKFVPSDRPLSPHLSIYKIYFSMVLSILHRITGVILYSSSLFVVIWMVNLLNETKLHFGFGWLVASFLTPIYWFAVTWILFHHMMGGVRHFVWDLGYCFQPKQRDLLSLTTTIVAAVINIVVWFIIIFII